MKIVKRALSIVLLLTFMLSTVSFAVTSSGYGSTVTMYAPDGRSIVVSVYEVPNWKAVGWYDYPVTIMYAPDGRQSVVYNGDVPAWKAVGWYDYPVTIMYAPDGRQMVIYTGDVPAWKAVGWYDYPVSVYGGGNSGSYYPNTNIPSFEPYGTLIDQASESGSDGSAKLLWLYDTTIDNANKYIRLLRSCGYYEDDSYEDYDSYWGDYEYISFRKDSTHSFDFIYSYSEDLVLIGYIVR